MLNAWVYLAPSQFEAIFISMAHTQADIDDVVSKAGEVFRKLGK